MKIPKKDKKTLEYDDITSSEARNLFAEEVNSTMESYFIIKGSSGTWEGRRNIAEGYAYHFESF